MIFLFISAAEIESTCLYFGRIFAKLHNIIRKQLSLQTKYKLKNIIIIRVSPSKRNDSRCEY